MLHTDLIRESTRVDVLSKVSWTG